MCTGSIINFFIVVSTLTVYSRLRDKPPDIIACGNGLAVGAVLESVTNQQLFILLVETF